MSSLNNIYEIAKMYKQKNDEAYLYIINKEKEFKKANEESITNYEDGKEIDIEHIEDHCYSKELYEEILKRGFKIEKYVKYENVDPNEYCPIYEKYKVSYNNWSFTIQNVGDFDIEEGIWMIGDLVNINTNEKVDFYCDLQCNNTSEHKLDRFLKFLEYNSEEEFIRDYYAKYYDLTKLLKDNHFVIDKQEFNFCLNGDKSYIGIDMGDSNLVYIVMYDMWHDEMHMVITNDMKWGINSYNRDHEVGYYFDYKSEEDIDELIKCIVAYNLHQIGIIGYYEDNGYRNNHQLYTYFSSVKEIMEEAFRNSNTSFKIQTFKPYDGRGFYKDAMIINKYTGLEIYKDVVIEFEMNPIRGGYSEPEEYYKNISYINIKYNKNESDKVKLTIKNYVTSSDYYNDVNDKHEPVFNDKEPIDIYVKEGSFSEVLEDITNYIGQMCNIFK